MPLDRAWIESRIPHRLRMCLLESVEVWDTMHVVCRATSHRDTDNPLRAHGRLSAACGIEYAAQAMAVHGALAVAGDAAPPAGYLASVREVLLHVDRLDNVDEPLAVEALRRSGDGSSILYQFAIRAGARELLRGRAAVLLDAGKVRRARAGGVA